MLLYYHLASPFATSLKLLKSPYILLKYCVKLPVSSSGVMSAHLGAYPYAHYLTLLYKYECPSFLTHSSIKGLLQAGSASVSPQDTMGLLPFAALWAGSFASSGQVARRTKRPQNATNDTRGLLRRRTKRPQNARSDRQG